MAKFAWAFALLLATAGSRAQAEVPSTVADADWPGTISLQVDASDVERRIQQVRERIPVRPGPLTLWYPKWIPGNHSPTGPINQLAGLIVRGNGARIAWTRDDVDMYAFHIDVPQGIDAIDLEFQYLSPTAKDQGRVAMTPDMLDLQWHRVLLYPAGVDTDRIRVEPSLTLPQAWQSASALQVAARDGGTLHYASVSATTLVDSPVYAGRNYKRIALDADAKQPVFLDAFADDPEQLDISPTVLAAHRALVAEADTVFGTRPFAHYDFLLALSDTFSRIGLEHRQSSENGTPPDYLLGEAPFGNNTLLSHEYAHAWNGKFRRPSMLWTPNYNVPMRNELLWLYEGQTEYWSIVLAARAGLLTPQQARETLADLAATQAQRRGHDWRSLQDTMFEGIVEFNDAPQAWESWQRAYDFYSEGALLWLDVDTRIRELSNGKRSLDDFARGFFANAKDVETVSTYGFDDIVATLEAVQPGGWRDWLRQRLDGDKPLLGGIARGGWKLGYDATPNLAVEDNETADEVDDFRYSLGLKIDRDGGTIGEVVWDGPAFKAGLARDVIVVAVNGEDYDAKRLQRAIAVAKETTQPIELLVRQGERYRTVKIDWRDGLRAPHLVRDVNAPDLLGAILAPRR
ncbi:M61 family metallopeptidase [Pseudoluteimonas lycopersici]|uniref:M61 family metallopeptidase n=1 Tax=Pseudoluteimonas lycopersici TaxID=1324796 RepID=A0A516V644_9GAMM|nr:M61 family metallopeptidase [Lysobacter lycopersici]QDQ73999.1 M61 family metallopeptidase [Lysobacter lycopersici]